MKRLLAALFVASISISARAQDTSHANPEPLPYLSLDCGVGAAEVALGGSRFRSMTGAALGLRHPSGIVITGVMHVFPIPKFRNVGFVTSFEAASLTPDGTVPSTISSDDSPSLFSVVGGPEAQARFGSFVLRGSAVAGFRMISFGDYSWTEPRVAARAQADFVFAGLAFGTFGSVDLVPALGWTWGVSVSFAMF